MPQMTGGEAVVETLAHEGARVVFGLIGSHVMDIYDALYECPDLQVFDARQEQAVGYMADGYARATGQVGVCLVTAGPGATNIVTALGESYSDSVPLLLISGQIETHLVDREKGAFHECKSLSDIFRSVTTWNARANTVAEIPDLIQEALRRFRTGRPRPIAIEIPHDLGSLSTQVELAAPPPFRQPDASSQEIDAAAVRLAEAKRPIIWAGGGVISATATAELMALAEHLQAPVVMTAMGKGALPADHPLALGYWTKLGPVKALLHESDVMLATGTRFTEMATSAWSLQLPPALIQVDIDPQEIGKNYPVEIGIVADAKIALAQLLQRLRNQDDLPRPSRITEVIQMRDQIRKQVPDSLAREYKALADIRRVIDRDAIVVNDVTTMAVVGRTYFDVFEPRSYLYPVGYGALGYALPAALGAKIGAPEKQVIAICGDGGFMFNVQELATAVRYGLNIVVVLINDNCFGAIKNWQQRQYGGRVIGADLVNPDFMQLADAFGVIGRRFDSLDDLGPALESALGEERLVILEFQTALQHPGFG